MSTASRTKSSPSSGQGCACSGNGVIAAPPDAQPQAQGCAERESQIEFLEIFHELVAKAQNASLGRWENLWSSDKTSVVLLVSDHDVLDKMAYTLANPTVAGLVKSPLVWPGVISKRFGERVEMPDHFFDHEGELPETLTLRFLRAPIFVGLSDAQVQARLNSELAQLVRRAREDMALRRLPFVGPNAVLRQRFSAAPKTPAPRRNPSPRIAAKSTTARVDAIRRMLEFAHDYRAIWSHWRKGNRAAVFPLGTYALRVYAPVACSPVRSSYFRSRSISSRLAVSLSWLILGRVPPWSITFGEYPGSGFLATASHHSLRYWPQELPETLRGRSPDPGPRPHPITALSFRHVPSTRTQHQRGAYSR